jgi:hypothetical protein
VIPTRGVDHIRQIVRKHTAFPGWVFKPDEILHIARQRNQVQFAVAIHIARDDLVTACQIIRQNLLLEMHCSIRNPPESKQQKQRRPCAHALRYAVESPERSMKKLLSSVLFTATLLAQPAGIWQGYDGEWLHVSQQLISLAETISPAKYAWRPAPGVRSTSEVYVHIALANFFLLSATGVKMPAEVSEGMGKKVTSNRKSSLSSSVPWKR